MKNDKHTERDGCRKCAPTFAELAEDLKKISDDVAELTADIDRLRIELSRKEAQKEGAIKTV